MLQSALEEARQGRAEEWYSYWCRPVSTGREGSYSDIGHNPRRVQDNDPSAHAETDAFRKAGRQRRYRDTIMVTTSWRHAVL